MARLGWVTALALLTAFVCQAADDNSSETFKPTDEWQTVKKGQSVPAGLHVKMNLEMGTVEAKLMDSKEEGKKALSVLPKNESDSDSNSNNTIADDTSEESINTVTKMKEALKNIPNEDPNDKGETYFRTLDELKSEFSDLKIKVKTDMQILANLFRRYERLKRLHPSLSPSSKGNLNEIPDKSYSAEMLDILVDFEYLVHQIDNGNEFVRLKGLENIIYPHLNGTDNILKAEVLKVLCACLQNNIKAQTYALETDLGDKLLRILSLDSNEHVKERAIRTMSTLIRGFPLAQKHVLSNHAMDVFNKLLMSPSHFKLKITLLILLDDLVLEYRLISEFHSSRQEDVEKLKQYREVDILGKLSNPIFCDTLSKLLREYFKYDDSALDYLHQIIITMTTFAQPCRSFHYKDDDLILTLSKMQRSFKKIMQKVAAENIELPKEKNEYYTNILDFIENYFDILHNRKLRDEL